MSGETRIKSVAVIGAGAAGAITASALESEKYFDRITVFERRETPGGTWIYDADPHPSLTVYPGKLPSDVDPPLGIPENLPQVSPPNQQERYSQTPVYQSLTSNVPDIAMSYSDSRFAYGPFVPHYIVRQYIENYFSQHKTDSTLVLNTTVEDVSRLTSDKGINQWKLTLRKYEPLRHVDIWWEEVFDAVVLANGHYSVPYVPAVPGLETYLRKFPGRVVHSKYYRSPQVYSSKRVLIIGNSASGHDVTAEVLPFAQLPVYQSRRSKSRWDGDEPPSGIEWKPVIKEFRESGEIVFEDDTILDDIDVVIYCTGYKPSYPFWNDSKNGRPIWDYNSDRLINSYWHTFFHDFPTLGIVGLPRALTFRSFEYQAIALARIFAGRNAIELPPVEEQQKWERQRVEKSRTEGQRFHDIQWETGETFEYLDGLFRIAGLGTLNGAGRIPPVLGEDLIWAIEHLRKYPEPGKDKEAAAVTSIREPGDLADGEWVMVKPKQKDLLAFI